MKQIRMILAVLLCILLCGCGQTANQPAPTVSGQGLWVHYLDVGQADCALLECDGEYILIDGGNIGDSAQVVSYLEQAGVEELKAVICSHAHEDHVGGLPGVLAVYPTAAVYAPTRTYASDCYDDFVYYTDQQGLSITIPTVGDTLTFGQARVEVLGPVKSYPETNDTSLVLMVRYGDSEFLFTGDMEITAEADLLESGADLKADVLKVGHHGSDTSTSYRFLYEADPDHAIISVGEGNKYGHPSDQILSRLEDAEVTVYRTDRLGTVVAHSDGKKITVTWQTDTQPQVPAGEDTVYIGNKKSKILHTESCASLPAESNQVLFDQLQTALDEGYRLCTRCME